MSSWLMGRRMALLLLLAIPAGGAAQEKCATWVCASVEVPSIRMDAQLAGINAALGAFTVGVTSLIRDGHVSWKSMALGAVGGAAIFAGKRIAVEPFDGSGLLGRQVAGLGGAMVYNVGHGDGPVDRVGFAFGPLRLEIAKGDGTRLVVDATSTIAAAYVALDGSGARLDPHRSFSSGALVFRDSGLDRPGRSLGSVILLRDRAGTYDDPIALHHETVHVIQTDQLFWSLTADTDRWIASKLLPTGWEDHVVPGLPVLMIGGVGRVIRYDDRPWEVEAYRITGH